MMRSPTKRSFKRTHENPRWQKDIHVAACFDEKMSLPFLALASSLKRAQASSERKLILFAVHIGHLKEEVARLKSANEKTFEVRFVPVDNVGPRYKSKRHVSAAAYLRLLLPSLLPDIDKILYLDVDTIILRQIDNLYDTDLHGHALGACRDLALTIYSAQLGFKLNIASAVSRDEGVDIFEYLRDTIGLSAGYERDYFNSGVMIIDTRKWKQENISDRATEWALRNPESIFHDQDALNATFKGAYHKVDHRWNAPATCCDLTYLQRNGVHDLSIAGDWWDDPWIVHFVGPAKPWCPVPYSTVYDYLFWAFAAGTDAFESLSPAANPDSLSKGLAIWKKEQETLASSAPKSILQAAYSLLTSRKRYG